MAVVEILQWSTELIDKLTSRVASPVSLAELREMYPDMARNTLKNRIDTLLSAEWLREHKHGYVLHPRMAQRYARINRGFVDAVGDAVDLVKMYQ